MEGLEFVLVREDSAAAVILENLTVNERGFDELAPDVDPSAVDGFRSHLRDCAAVTARADGVAVAGGMFTPVRESRCELMGIAALAPYRRQGFGTALTAELVRAAIAAGAETVFLTTDDATALRSYRRVGFRDVPSDPAVPSHS